MYDNARNIVVLFTYTKNPKATLQIACRKAPAVYRNFTPICVPNFPNNGADNKAAKFAMPNTSPY